MNSKYIKRCLTSLVNIKMQIKNTEILDTTMAKIKMTVKFQGLGLCKVAQLFGKLVGQFFKNKGQCQLLVCYFKSTCL